MGGLTGADANCQASANTAGYGGVWKAILSDSKSNAKDRLTIAYPAVRASDGATVAATDLFFWKLDKPTSTGTCVDGWTGEWI